ncbi:PorT family protein [Polaribacter sargassicola]|uniref:PorT family protein n=1 Tax=Polaribacter sargassicola TaxID=2836891 RepID=UPI001F341CC1|nr:PorT family protein [Polaribacter sp. DS7-9]MCG1037106.1 hypothetical protein [Polaribacter sp. DS7-9]
MKKLFTLCLIFILTSACYAQNIFSKGYFIDSTDNKVECFIKNINYSNVNDDIKYRLSEKSKTETTSLSSIKEIVLYDSNKFIKSTVDIGRSNKINENNRDYIFNKEKLFLKVLIEGEASLYSYNEKGIEIFFFKTNDTEIKQLVYKKYKSKKGNTESENIKYKKQLFNSLVCKTITFDTAMNLQYENKYLVDYFIKFNKCKNSSNIVYYKKAKIFNINLRPRVSNVSLVLDETGGDINPESFDFRNATLFGVGIEAEILFSFLNSKWTFSIEPTYHQFNSELIINNIESVNEVVNVEYKSIEMPLSLRHYFNINKSSKIFLNTSLVFDFPLAKSNIERKFEVSESNVSIDEFEISGSANFAFGAGYKFKNRYSVEARYYTNRNVINHLISHSTSYKMFSIIFGYTIF